MDGEMVVEPGVAALWVPEDVTGVEGAPRTGAGVGTGVESEDGGEVGAGVGSVPPTENGGGGGGGWVGAGRVMYSNACLSCWTVGVALAGLRLRPP